MTRFTLLALASLLAAGAAAQADEIGPLAGKAVALGTAAGVVYYTEEAGGFRVVATMTGAEGTVPLRFTAMLADGQTVVVSIPVAVGETPREIEIARKGDRLMVGDAERPMVRASLD